MPWLESTVQQLHDVYSGAPWYGKPLKKILEEVNPAKAGICPAAGSHSIYQLAKHILSWRTYVLEMVKGHDDYRVDIDSDADWASASPVSEMEWKKLVEALATNQQDLVKVLEETPEGLLNKAVPGKAYDFKHLIDGMMQHDIYHAGQIAATAKLIGSNKVPS